MFWPRNNCQWFWGRRLLTISFHLELHDQAECYYADGDDDENIVQVQIRWRDDVVAVRPKRTPVSKRRQESKLRGGSQPAWHRDRYGYFCSKQTTRLSTSPSPLEGRPHRRLREGWQMQQVSLGFFSLTSYRYATSSCTRREVSLRKS